MIVYFLILISGSLLNDLYWITLFPRCLPGNLIPQAINGINKIITAFQQFNPASVYISPDADTLYWLKGGHWYFQRYSLG